MKMMIVCPHFNDIEYGIVESFKRLGIETHSVFFNIGISKQNYFQRIKNRMGLCIDKFLYKEKLKFNEELLTEFDRLQPDIVYVIQGRWVDVESIRYIKRTSYIALYLWDMVGLFPEMYVGFSEYNIIYTFDQHDANVLQSEGYHAKFKPSGYDNSIYYPMLVEKKYDIAFVGTMYNERVKMLDELIQCFPNVKWAIYGEYAPIRKPVQWLKWVFSGKHKYYQNKNIKKEMVNELYNSSHIILSIVRDNQEDGWSSRLPEILGTSSFQITNYFASVEKEFSDSLVMYRNLNELKSLLTYYLSHDEERKIISRIGYNKVKNNYTDDILNQVIIDDYLFWCGDKSL